MNLIEIHLLQSFPFTCLNRDDVGSPKTAVFGGVQRARVSSQCWKRAIREYAFDFAPKYFTGKRGLYHSTLLTEKLVERNMPREQAAKLAKDALVELVGKGKNEGQTAVALYLSESELNEIADVLTNSSEKVDKKVVSKAIKGAKRRDAADVSIFGRMVADDHSLMLEAAGMFSHALSTHAVSNETDFFSAVDDTKDDDSDAGAGHIGVLEANSACYYRYIGLNLDLFNDDKHLKDVDLEDRKIALKVFLRAVLEAVPGARKNSMFGYTLPQYALGLVRKGQPLSLVNAFEKPVKPGKDGGLVGASIDALENHRKDLNQTYGLASKGEFKLGDIDLDCWIESVVNTALEG